MTDVSRHGSMSRSSALQARLFEAAHPVVRGSPNPINTPQDFYKSVRAYLLKASDQCLIKQSPREVRVLLLKTPTSKSSLLIAVGSVRNFNRDPTLPHFSRQDGGWFDFQLEVAAIDGTLRVLWYDFELRLPEASPVAFVRLDLNPLAHTNDERAMRSHLHVGSDDDGWWLPAPVLSPFEALDIMISGLIPRGRSRHRAPHSSAGATAGAMESPSGAHV